MSDLKSGLIFIPDISGFTNFVNDMEILHGQEILGELLEEIIEADDLGFEISEIEGDAVLFYKLGLALHLKDIYLQSLKTLQKFKSRIAKIQEKRICECGACVSVSNLTLKFILHYDKMEIMKIRKFDMLFGKGVIIAHRLMKNNLKEKEYILFTKDYLEHIIMEKLDFTLNHSVQVLDNFGEIDCYYINLELPN
ncbi:MAG: DUF2652 domain-containing protein [Melioribacteraceae bacterium]|nr:DUF2652 domain-containing protein [Melioribacteraceae bacterium]MCF8356585.1 DUF2652 domain-containing protein [Melioribacteraceae bacterium]MCF8395976.1 DUF2652 domain-containing protein [Melioribacteraceae bacterium]MCF8421027.1 DUF2652 domain-containing protein [Melioribacteraceae bacterium]